MFALVHAFDIRRIGKIETTGEYGFESPTDPRVKRPNCPEYGSERFRNFNWLL
jgi:hypothetical protein